MDRPIVINIKSILGTLVVVGNDIDAVRISGKVEKALIKVIKSVQKDFTDCKIQVDKKAPEIVDNGGSRSHQSAMENIKTNSAEPIPNEKDQLSISAQSNPETVERNGDNYTTVEVRVLCEHGQTALINQLLSQVRFVVESRSQSDIETERLSQSVRAQY
jgi:hypothetical protein